MCLLLRNLATWQRWWPVGSVPSSFVVPPQKKKFFQLSLKDSRTWIHYSSYTLSLKMPKFTGLCSNSPVRVGEVLVRANGILIPGSSQSPWCHSIPGCRIKKTNNWTEPNKNKRNICSSFGQRDASVYCLISSHFQWSEKKRFIPSCVFVRTSTINHGNLENSSQKRTWKCHSRAHVLFSWCQYISFAL